MNICAQHLDQHQWKNRIIVVKAKNNENTNLKNQLSQFQNHKKELLDRKLVLYQVIDNNYSFTNFRTEPKAFSLISNHKDGDIFKMDKDFEVILIGLDGGIKLRQHKLLSLKELFNTIDAMPMRQNEIRNQK